MKDVGEIAKEWYDKNEPKGALAACILRCFFIGVLIKRPGFLLMAETALWDGETLAMVPRENANTWFLHFWASTKPMSSYELCLEAPFPLECVAFKRRGKLKCLKWEHLYNKDIGHNARTYTQ